MKPAERGAMTERNCINTRKEKYMDSCKHDLSYLMGTKDGIVCRKCGRLFSTFDEIYPKTEAPEPVKEPDAVPTEKPKRKGRTKKDA